MADGGAHTVLNVNGDDRILRARSGILTRAGCRVLEAGTGEEALRMGAVHRPELVLMDVALPDTSGTEVCRLLKENQTTARIMVLLVAAGAAGRRAKTESVRAGADGYLNEPVEPGELVASVQALLRLHQREAENHRLLEQLVRERAARKHAERRLHETEERCRVIAEAAQQEQALLAGRRRADLMGDGSEEVKERLQYALDSADMVAWDWIPDTDALIQSSNAARVLGLPAGTTLRTGKEYVAMIHQEDQPRVVAAIQRALREESDYHEEFRLVMADASLRWVADRGRVTKSEAGQGARMTGVIRDITGLKMREMAVRESEERFRAIFNQAAVGMCLISPEGHLLQVNQKLCTLLDERAGSLLQRKLLDLTHPEDRRRNQEVMSRLLLGGVADVSIEQRLVQRGGRAVWVSIYLGLLWDAGGRLEHVIGVVQDIDERKRVEEALRDSDRRFREMINALPAAIYTTDVQGRLTHFNPAAVELSGRTPVLGTDHWCVTWKLYRPDGTPLPHDECPMAVALRENRLVRGEEAIAERPDGTRIWFMPYPTPLRDSQGRVVGGINMLVDITERKEAEKQLRLLNADLEERVAVRTRELVHSQNQLRKLASDLSIAEERERRRVAGELHDYLAQLLVATRMKLNQARHGRAGARLSDVLDEVDEMLDQSLTYTRTLVSQLSPPVLHEFGLAAALKWLGEQMPRHGLTVSSTIDAESLNVTENQAVLLFQSARELLLNIVKHARTDRACLQLEARRGELRVTITDQGCGFDPSSLKETTASENAFGLFSIRERMESLGGRLEIAARPGHGTTVTLIMPLTPQVGMRNEELGMMSEESGMMSEESGMKNEGLGVRNDELTDAAPGASPSENSTFHIPHSSFEPKAKVRVLLVDDHAMVRQGLRSLLENHRDVEVVAEAGDGLQAIAFAETLSPDVVVMDLSLPLLDGVEATKRICLTHPGMVVIGLSVHQSPHMEQAVRTAGAASFLTKDCAVDQLYEAISSAMMARSS